MKSLCSQNLLNFSSVFLVLTAVVSLAGKTTAQPISPSQFFEIRTYVLGDQGDADAIDDYLEHAFLPALKRNGFGPVGVFSATENDTNDRDAIVVVIPFDGGNAIATLPLRLQQDKQYLADAKPYLERDPKDPPYARITSELLVAMNCMPTLNLPDGTLENEDRVYELRVYESANERLGNLKVEMFNNGEVPIFLDSGITPIFIGQALIGPQTPNLTYLTVYPNEAARLKAWDAFRSHPDWQVLKAVEKYKGTVSKIDKYILSAKPYSQL